ncbi:hypothetical protein [Thermus altitudinis]|uniref:hypothetical protein n=1 Tax=Thermus altitudinis TaxID=2908145 RepID=UPI001FAAA84A|nr:hypothetical protein [Thermus altitudinis]
MKGVAVRFLGLFLALALGLALAAGTPAGTAIQNQASASYIDSAGQPKTTTSNLVTTLVQQVYSFTITPDGTETNPGQIRNGLPGGQVLFQYTVTNTGNGTDTINLSTLQGTADNFDLSNIKIYLDGNCNGNVDAGEPQISSVTLAADASACVIVAATIPATAQSGQYGNLNLAGTSQGNNQVTDNNNWARAVATTQAALTAFKAATPSGNVQPGGIITYTISGSNTGGSPAYGIPVTVDNTPKTGILIEDTIPYGLTVISMPTGSAGAGSIRYIYYDGTAWMTLTTNLLPITGDGIKKIGMLIEGTGAFFTQGTQYTFSFQAQVPSNAPAGISYANSATVKFDANGDGDANDPGETINTNTTTNTVAATYQPLVGYPGNVTLGNETQEVASAYAGQVVSFTNVVRNGGNAPDSFTLSLQNSTFPTGTTCSIYAADGITPISGPIGPLAPGAEQNVVVKCQLPATYYENPADGQTTTYKVELKATSVNDPSKSDITTNKLVDILPGYAVDLAAQGYSGDNIPGNDNPAGQNANPGQTVFFPLELTNTGANPDTYNLSGTVPAGWTVVFYPDTNCDGQPDGAPITNVGPVNPTQKVCFVAAVTVPQGAAPEPKSVTFTATSTNNSSVYDTVSTTVTVNLVAQISLDPDRQGTVTSPGTIQYTHTLRNDSNAQAICNISGTGGAYGWTYQYSTNGTDWYGALGNVYVNPNGGTVTIYVRVIVPAGEPIGRTDVNTVTATCQVDTGTATDTATETTTVVGGELRLEKQVDKTTAYPGETLTYTITATNIGTGDLKQVIITDPLPAYTDFVSVSATIQGFPAGATVLYSTNGTTWSTTAPTTLPAGGSIYVAVDTNGDNTITSADIMPPAATITITFKVQVQ